MLPFVVFTFASSALVDFESEISSRSTCFRLDDSSDGCSDVVDLDASFFVEAAALILAAVYGEGGSSCFAI